MNGSIKLWCDTIREITGPTEGLTCLDLCCGEMTAVKELKFKGYIGVDLIDYPNRPKHLGFRKENVLSINPVLFDVCLCSDGIEHFNYQDGLKLLDRMEQWGRIPIIFTPTGQPASELEPDSTDPHTHKSSWTPEYFQARGWQTKHFPDWHPTLPWCTGALFAWRPAK